MYPRYHPHLAARHVAKSHEATPFGCKDPSSNTLRFKPIFDHPLKKVVRGPPSPVGGALVRLGDSLARVKIWGAAPPRGRNMVFRKMRLGYVKMCAYNFVHGGRNFTNFFLLTAKGSFSSTPFRLCRYLHRFQRYSWSNSKVVVKRTKFLTFFALPNFKWDGAPKFRTCVNTTT